MKIDSFFTISGKIFDFNDNSTLPGVTVRVADMDKGTFSNSKGEFKLKLPKGMHTLMFRMIGMDNVIKDIDLNKNISDLEILMKINPQMLEGVVVIAEDPGARLMRRVIKRKLDQRDSLRYYSYDLYTRFTASTDTITAGRTDSKSDTTIVSIFESYSRGYFKSPDNYYNQIFQRRQSVNIPPEANFVAFGTNLNAYDDFVSVLSEEIYSPFHPKAVDFYDFILDTNYRDNDNLNICKVIATPGSKTRKMFTGYLFIDSTKLIPTKVNLSPNEAVNLPFNALLFYIQDFKHIDSQFVMPERLHIYTSIDANLLWVVSPRIDINIRTFAYNYSLNQKLDDGLFNRLKVEATKNADKYDTLFWKSNEFIKLTKEESLAYDAIRMARDNPDSVNGTNIFDEVLGPINRLAANLNRKPFTGYQDMLMYNRIHGLYLGISAKSFLTDNLQGSVKTGYGFATKEIYADVRFDQYFDENNQYGLTLRGYNWLERIDRSFAIRQQFLSLASFLFKSDYGDYYHATGGEIALKAGFGQLRFIRREYFEHPSTLSIFFRSENQSTVSKNIDFALLNWNGTFRDNPMIVNGIMNSFGFEINWNYHKERRLSDFGLHISGEISNPNIIWSNFDFQQYLFGLNLRTRTLPLWKLDARINAGISFGDLPPQKFFSLETSVSTFSGSTSLRGAKVKEFHGDRYLSLSFEHNFGEVIPGILRIPNIAAFGVEFILFGNIAYSEFTDAAKFIKNDIYKYLSTSETPDKYYYEFGLGFNKLLIFLRVDLGARFSQNNFPKFFFSLTSASF